MERSTSVSSPPLRLRDIGEEGFLDPPGGLRPLLWVPSPSSTDEVAGASSPAAGAAESGEDEGSGRGAKDKEGRVGRHTGGGRMGGEPVLKWGKGRQVGGTGMGRLGRGPDALFSSFEVVTPGRGGAGTPGSAPFPVCNAQREEDLTPAEAVPARCDDRHDAPPTEK